MGFACVTADVTIWGSVTLLDKSRKLSYAFPFQILTSVAGPLFRGNSAQVTDVNSKVLKWSKIVTEGESGCKEGLHRGSKFCCLPCPPGMLRGTSHS